MALADLRIAQIQAVPGQRPLDAELDLFGLTHPGKVRKENQDHFLLCTVHRQMVIHGTSLPESERLPLRGERLATIMLVADGVGGGTGGGVASQIAAETVTRYVATTMRCCHDAGETPDHEFHQALHAAALEAHAAVRAIAKAQAEATGMERIRGMATTLTMVIAVWPWAYVVQVGDSRCYHFVNGELHQVTRDQTVAQDLVDRGILPRDRQSASPLSHVLASAIGGGEAMPEVAKLDISQRGCVIFLCSDGLTKHVSDEEIAAHLRNMESSEKACRLLLDLALECGGSDNITILAGRARKGRPAD